MQVLQFKVERSQSRTRKHLLYSTVYVYRKKEGFVPYTKTRFSEQESKPTYARGEAKVVTVSVDHGDLVLYSWFIKNFKNKVKGYISIYSSRGELLYRAKYLSGYVVKSKGNPIYAWLVRIFLDMNKIPVTATNLGDEK